MPQETFSAFVSAAPAAAMPPSGHIPIVQSDGQTHALNAAVLVPAIQTGLVAHPGGGQSGAVPLVIGYNVVDTVASSNDSLLLPPAVAGSVVFIIFEGGGNFVGVYVGLWPTGDTDTINGNTALVDSIDLPCLNADASVGHGALYIVVCETDGAWFTNGVPD